MKVLLFFPKWTGEYGLFSHFARRSSVIPPLNLAYMAAVAEKAGHEVKMIDCEHQRLSAEELFAYIEEFKPGLIGTTSTSPVYHKTAQYAEIIRKRFPGIPIAIGGNHITVLKEAGLTDAFDYGFAGEAENSFPQFLNVLAKNGDVKSVKGIVYRENGKTVFTGPADSVKDINEIPLPARHLLKSGEYFYGTLQGRKRCATIMASRGCPFKCIFCTTDVFGNKVRRRRAELVIEEMKAVIRDFQVEHFYFLDDTLTLDRKYIIDLCDLIMAEKLKVTFEGGTRANCVDEEIIAKLSEAGCIRLSFGLEAVDPNIRKIMKKEVPLEAYITANRLTEKYHIETLNSCMIGLPGESRETIRELLRFLRKSKEIKQANLAIAIPYPGTELHEMAKRGDHGLKLVTDDFSKFWRYGSAVMQVGNLTPQDLVQLQNDAFASIYMAPWRYLPVLGKQGILGFLLTGFRMLKSFKRIIKNQDGLFWF